MSGLVAAIMQMHAKLRKPLDEQFVNYSLDAVNSTLIVTSLERSSAGVYGKYSGIARLTYEKLRLENSIPTALVYRGLYPIVFVQLRQWLHETYGLYVEENEFALESAPTVALNNNSYLTEKANPLTGEIRLVALPTSGRFVAGGVLRLLMAPSNGPHWMPGLVPSTIPGEIDNTLIGDLSTLSYPT